VLKTILRSITSLEVADILYKTAAEQLSRIHSLPDANGVYELTGTGFVLVMC
jgi:hypothetical protein